MKVKIVIAAMSLAAIVLTSGCIELLMLTQDCDDPDTNCFTAHHLSGAQPSHDRAIPLAQPASH